MHVEWSDRKRPRTRRHPLMSNEIDSQHFTKNQMIPKPNWFLESDSRRPQPKKLFYTWPAWIHAKSCENCTATACHMCAPTRFKWCALKSAKTCTAAKTTDVQGYQTNFKRWNLSSYSYMMATDKGTTVAAEKRQHCTRWGWDICVDASASTKRFHCLYDCATCNGYCDANHI